MGQIFNLDLVKSLLSHIKTSEKEIEKDEEEQPPAEGDIPSEPAPSFLGGVVQRLLKRAGSEEVRPPEMPATVGEEGEELPAALGELTGGGMAAPYVVLRSDLVFSAIIAIMAIVIVVLWLDFRR